MRTTKRRHTHDVLVTLIARAAPSFAPNVLRVTATVVAERARLSLGPSAISRGARETRIRVCVFAKQLML